MTHQKQTSQINLESIFSENCILEKNQFVAFAEGHSSLDDVLGHRCGAVLLRNDNPFFASYLSILVSPLNHGSHLKR